MFDEFFRHLKDAWLAPIARRLGPRVSPFALTLLALLAGLACALCAARGAFGTAAAWWGVNRVVDGLDGVQARVHRRASDFGGWADIVSDFVVYATVPIGIALSLDTRAAYVATMAMLGSYFVNAAAWMYLSALLERRGAGAAARGEVTSAAMPRGLVAGTETVVFFALFLLLPTWYVPLAWTMTAGVTIGVVQRGLWARALPIESSAR